MSVLTCSQCGARVSRVHGVSGQTDLFGIIADDRATADASAAVRAGRVLCSGCARTAALPGFGEVPRNHAEAASLPSSAPIGPGTAPEADPSAPEVPEADVGPLTVDQIIAAGCLYDWEDADADALRGPNPPRGLLSCVEDTARRRIRRGDTDRNGSFCRWYPPDSGR